MPLPKCLAQVDSDGYSAIPGNNVIATKLDGGASRYRVDKLGATATINVTWKLDLKGYNYLMAFYRTTIKQGSLPFTIDLILDGATVQEYTAHIVPESLQLSSQSGLSYTVQATLEVIPQTVDATADAATVTAGP